MEAEALTESLFSTPIFDLQEVFREKGYLFFRSFFPKALIEEKREAVLHILHSEGWGKLEHGKCIALSPAHSMHSPSFYQCVRRLMEEEALHQLAEFPPLSQLMNRLLEKKVFCHPNKMIRVTYPYHLNPKDKVPPHQDLFHVKGERETLTAWIPLGNYPSEAGGLLVAPETHKRGLFPVKWSGKGRARTSESALEKIVWYTTHYRMGDLLILDALTLHQSGKNEQDHFRLSLDCRFSSALGAVNEAELLPPYYPHVPHWDTLCRNWDDPNRLAYPATVHIQRKDAPLEAVFKTISSYANDQPDRV